MSVNIINEQFRTDLYGYRVYDNKLPKTSFVPFECQKLKHVEVVWVNEDLLEVYGLNGTRKEIEDFLLEEYSYVSDSYTNNSQTYNKRKIFWVDRYGSTDDFCNGGSSRCALDGSFQVKGIGVTPLLGKNVSESVPNGRLLLDEAIIEATWAELCHKHLPFGAIRTLAIIKTNVFQQDINSNDKQTKPCALAIREFVIRPAHFERATFFWPSNENMYLRYDDESRVREVIKYLPKTLGISNYELSSWKEMIKCIKVIISRLSKQVAYARIKGIPHSSLTSDNIGIDGRFLNFSDILNPKIFDEITINNRFNSISNEVLTIANWLKNFIKTLNKHITFNAIVTNQEAQFLMFHFVNEINHHENCAILNELNIIDKSKENLKKINEIKKLAIQDIQDKSMTFKPENFMNDIYEISKKHGLKVGDVNFKNRNLNFPSPLSLSDLNNLKPDRSYEYIDNFIRRHS